MLDNIIDWMLVGYTNLAFYSGIGLTCLGYDCSAIAFGGMLAFVGVTTWLWNTECSA